VASERKKRTARTVIAKPSIPPTSTGLEGGYKLVMMKGPQIGQEVMLDGTALEIGREDCSLTVDSDQLSRQHYAIEPDAAGYRVRDLESTNGTFVNGGRITTHALAPGDLVKAGGVVFKFMQANAVEAQYHEEMSKLVTTDALTGARNKRFFDDEFGKACYHAMSKKQPVSLIVLDIDFFKKVNDTHGHTAGDHVLAEISGVIASMVREQDIFARVGGEEFAIVMPGTERAVARAAAELIRGSVEMTEVVFEGTHIPVTLSLGVAQLNQGEFEPADAFYQRADAKLYEAKGAGRNQVQ